MTKDEYERAKKEILRNPQDEMDWSQDPHTAVEIMARTLMTLDPNLEGDYITFAYVSRDSNLTPVLIDDMLYVMSGAFDYDTFEWNDEAIAETVHRMCQRKENYILDWLRIADGEEESHLKSYAEKKAAEFLKTAHRVTGNEGTFEQLRKTYWAMEDHVTETVADYTDNIGLIKEDIKAMERIRHTLSRVIADAKHLTEPRRLPERFDWEEILKYQTLPQEWVEARRPLFGGAIGEEKQARKGRRTHERD